MRLYNCNQPPGCFGDQKGSEAEAHQVASRAAVRRLRVHGTLQSPEGQQGGEGEGETGSREGASTCGYPEPQTRSRFGHAQSRSVTLWSHLVTPGHAWPHFGHAWSCPVMLGQAFITHALVMPGHPQSQFSHALVTPGHVMLSHAWSRFGHARSCWSRLVMVGHALVTNVWSRFGHTQSCPVSFGHSQLHKVTLWSHPVTQGHVLVTPVHAQPRPVIS